MGYMGILSYLRGTIEFRVVASIIPGTPHSKKMSPGSQTQPRVSKYAIDWYLGFGY